MKRDFSKMDRVTDSWLFAVLGFTLICLLQEYFEGYSGRYNRNTELYQLCAFLVVLSGIFVSLFNLGTIHNRGVSGVIGAVLIAFMSVAVLVELAGPVLFVR